MTTASPAPASAAASTAWAAAPAEPLTFRKDDDIGFPVAGAVLLIALLAIAAWAWWHGRMRQGGAAAVPSSWRALLQPHPAGASPLRVVASLPAGAGARVAVVEWEGGRVLVGINGTGSPVALDKLPPCAPGDGVST